MKANNSLSSTMVRAGLRTYFIDVRKARTGKHYITITQSTFRTYNGEEHANRVPITIFVETLPTFLTALSEMVHDLTERMSKE